MILKKMILGAIMAGCVSIGATFAEAAKPVLTADQQAKLEELKAKLEAMRAEGKAGHDSLAAERKAAMEKFLTDHKAIMLQHKAGMRGKPHDAKGDMAERIKEMKEKQAGFKAHADSGAHGVLTAEQIADLKTKFDAWKAAHPDAKVPAAPDAPATP